MALLFPFPLVALPVDPDLSVRAVGGLIEEEVSGPGKEVVPI